MCDVGYDTEILLNSHSLNHVSKRNVECKICSKRFTSMVLLQVLFIFVIISMVLNIIFFYLIGSQPSAHGRKAVSM